MYFLVEEDIEERRIDLVNIIQLKELVKDLVVLDSQIIVQFEFFALIFNQRDMMLGQIIQLPSDPKQKSRPFTTQILNPFGYRGKQYIDHDGLLYCYTIDGQARLVRSTRISTNGLQLNKKIWWFFRAWGSDLRVSRINSSLFWLIFCAKNETAVTQWHSISHFCIRDCKHRYIFIDTTSAGFAVI